MMKNLRFCMRSAYESGNNKHAQLAMRDLGITYQHCVPQSIADQWWFFNCEGIPDPMPSFLSELSGSPDSFIGYGLSADDAKRIADYPGSIEKLISDDFAKAFAEADDTRAANGYYITGTGCGAIE